MKKIKLLIISLFYVTSTTYPFVGQWKLGAWNKISPTIKQRYCTPARVLLAGAAYSTTRTSYASECNSPKSAQLLDTFWRHPSPPETFIIRRTPLVSTIVTFKNRTTGESRAVSIPPFHTAPQAASAEHRMPGFNDSSTHDRQEETMSTAITTTYIAQKPLIHAQGWIQNYTYVPQLSLAQRNYAHGVVSSEISLPLPLPHETLGIKQCTIGRYRTANGKEVSLDCGSLSITIPED